MQLFGVPISNALLLERSLQKDARYHEVYRQFVFMDQDDHAHCHDYFNELRLQFAV